MTALGPFPVRLEPFFFSLLTFSSIGYFALSCSNKARSSVLIISSACSIGVGGTNELLSPSALIKEFLISSKEALGGRGSSLCSTFDLFLSKACCLASSSARSLAILSDMSSSISSSGSSLSSGIGCITTWYSFLGCGRFPNPRLRFLLKSACL
uniref:Uncharacterized protein n=1 Tax=Cucumis sativus TaxID=3659 RepID=A0A0A0K8J8_CUCSA